MGEKTPEMTTASMPSRFISRHCLTTSDSTTGASSEPSIWSPFQLADFQSQIEFKLTSRNKAIVSIHDLLQGGRKIREWGNLLCEALREPNDGDFRQPSGIMLNNGIHEMGRSDCQTSDSVPVDSRLLENASHGGLDTISDIRACGWSLLLSENATIWSV
jgi:hypothetical protein